ncbi:MAG: cell wall-binding protein, partial [Anaerolineae bacterium]|nr:cell wall-binding protein [Anaerolineae bacterium]
ATPDSSWGFAGWSGDLSGYTNPATLVMDGHKTVTAIFEWQHDLTVEVLGTGSIVLDPPGGVYSHDTIVQITAIPDPGWTFSHWSGDLVGT